MGAMCFGLVAKGSELPLGIGEQDVRDIARQYVLGSAHRAWTAHGILNPGLGLDLGVDTTLVQRNDMHYRGQGGGVIPRTIPVPRIWAAWDLQDFWLSGSMAPGSIYGGIDQFGLGFQWTYWRERERLFQFSLLLNYSYVDVFGDLRGHATEIFQQISKDMIIWQPYLGFGMSVANAIASADILAPGLDQGPWTALAFRWYVGVRLDFLAKLSFQVDFVNMQPSFALLIAHSF